MPPKTKKPSSGTKKPVAKPSRKQPAKKKQPPPQKRRPPTPSSSSEDDSDDESQRRRDTAECMERWGASCPYADVVLHLGRFSSREPSETHEFSSGTVKPAVDEWTCPCEVEYKPREGGSEWFTVSDESSLMGSFGVEVREDEEYDYEVNYDIDCEFDLGTHDLLRVLREQEKDEKKWTKSKTYYNLNYWVLFGGSALFDVKVEENEDERVFKVRLREAGFSIPKYKDVLERMERTPKRPKGPRKQLVQQVPRVHPEELRKQVESLEAENAKLKRRLARYEGKVLDLTAEDSDEEAPPPPSELRELHDKETKRRAAQVKKERDDHESRGELLDSMVTPLESQRRELQEMVSAAAEALMERDVPTRMLADDAAPFYYSQNSWEAEQEIPWNAEADRPMSLAEGIAWVHDNAKPPRKRRR